jgi:RecA-family ATPase
MKSGVAEQRPRSTPNADPAQEPAGLLVHWPHPQFWSAQPQAQVRKPTFRILSRNDFEELPEPDWLIEGLLAQDSFAVLFGAPEAGKSFLALDFAASIATGKKFLGLFPLGKDAQGDVFYIVGESGNRFPKRIRAWEVAKNKGEKIPFFGLNGPVDMTDLRQVEALVVAIRAAVGERKLRLFVVDTLARCFGALDENSTKDMNAFVAGCDMLRSAFPGRALSR